jgi:nucleoside phosphorylase
MDYAVPTGRKGHATVAIVTIIDEEFASVRKVLKIDSEIEGTQYYRREQPAEGRWDVVLGQPTGRSNIPCGNFVGELIEDFRPQLLLLVGIAGGLCDAGVGRDGLGLGDVVIADAVSYIEFLKITSKGHFYRHYAIDQPSVHLRGAISNQIARSFKIGNANEMPPPVARDFRVFIGEIVSAEKILSGVDDPVQSALLKPFDKALAIDMESIGMARMVCERRTSFWYNPRFAVIRGISDLVGHDDNSDTRVSWKTYAASSAAHVAEEFINRFGVLKP